MKYFFPLLLIFILTVSNTTAQFGQNHAIYLSNELNVGNYLGTDMGINYVYKEKYSFKFSYTGSIRKSYKIPDDYFSGLVRLSLLFFNGPYDEINTYKIEAGKIYKFNKKGTIRLNLALGIGYSTIREPENWKKVNPSGLVDENYTYEYQSFNNISFTLSPKIEFPVSRIYGFTVSPMLQVSGKRTYYGFGFGSMLGLLRKKNKK